MRLTALLLTSLCASSAAWSASSTARLHGPKRVHSSRAREVHASAWLNGGTALVAAYDPATDPAIQELQQQYDLFRAEEILLLVATGVVLYLTTREPKVEVWEETIWSDDDRDDRWRR